MCVNQRQPFSKTVAGKGLPPPPAILGVCITGSALLSFDSDLIAFLFIFNFTLYFPVESSVQYLHYQSFYIC